MLKRIFSRIRTRNLSTDQEYSSFASEIIESGYFNESLYSESAGVKFESTISAAEHYLSSGEKRGFRPHREFDPDVYAALNPDLVGLSYPLIVHFIRHGRGEGRRAYGEKEVTSVESEVLEIASSPFFDIITYSRNAGETFASIEDAAEHYRVKGEEEGIRPHKNFDPLVYRLSHPDLEFLPFPHLLHYSRHGREEGRVAVFDADEMLLEGKRQFDPALKSVLVNVHDLSLTGAPVLALNLIRRLAATMNVVCVSAHGGSLSEAFRNETVMLAAPREGWLMIEAGVMASRLILPLKERFSIDAAIVNSVEAASLAKACHIAELPVVSLVHEFADYVYPRDKITTILGNSQKVVFSSRLTERSMLDLPMVSAELRNTTVIPQGKSDLPSDGNDRESLYVEAAEGLTEDGRFVVVGSGHVQIRKGVDLFIAVASRVAAILGPDKVKFVWVGDGYAPEVPGDYSGWLKSQIDRSGLEGSFSFIPALPLPQLEEVYQVSGAMFLSSRLDPFPNVAIDAFSAGLPVVCFEQASGIAEYLRQQTLLSELVVPFFDIEAAAAVIAKLATDVEWKAQMSQRLKKMAKREFNFDIYADRISALMEDAKRAHEVEQQDVLTLIKSELFFNDVAWLGRRPPDRYHLIRDYVRLDASGGFSAAPRPLPGFSPHIYAEQTGLQRGNALADWLRREQPEGPWQREVISLGGNETSHKMKVALHIHLHYDEMISDFVERLAVNRTVPDLFLTTSSDSGASRLEEATEDYPGKVIVKKVPNVGRDIAPMLVGCAKELEAYDLVGHLHGKRSSHISTASGSRDFVAVWREFLLENLLGGIHSSLDEIGHIFESNEAIGMLFPEDPFICGWGRNRGQAMALADRIGIKALPGAIEFPVGNMFYFRPTALAPLFDVNFRYEDFPPEPAPIDGTMMHALERITPLVCTGAGFKWVTTQVHGVSR